MKSMEFYQLISGLSLGAIELGSKEYARNEDKDSVEAYKTRVANLISIVNELKKPEHIFTSDDHSKLIRALNAVNGSARKIKAIIGDDAFSKIAVSLSAINQAAAYIDPSKNMTLSKTIDSVEIGNYSVKGKSVTAGANSSIRRKLAVRMGDNQEVQGYFTSDSKLFENEDGNKVMEFIENYAREHDDYEVNEFVNTIKKNPYGIHSLFACFNTSFATDKIKGNRLSVSQCYREDLLRELRYLTGFDGINTLDNNENMKQLLIKIRKSISDENAKRYMERFIQYGGFDGYGIKADRGSSIAGRSIAMSNVANILGVPTLVAKAVPMTVKEAGKEVSGVFMEKARGKSADSQDLDKTDFMLLNYDSFDGAALRQMADLQVLDYLCQNVDRHYANMLYEINEQGKIVGIQGIDNDLSFGTVRPGGNRTLQNGTALNDITVMTKGMADRIKELQPELFEASLMGLGLTKEEISAAGTRLLELKYKLDDRRINTGRVLEKGKIKIINDKSWERMHLAHFSATTFENNQSDIYSRAMDTLRVAMRVRKEKFHNNVEEYRRKREAKYKKLKNVEYFTDTKEIDELSAEALNENQTYVLNLYQNFIKFEKNQGEDLGNFNILKSKLERLLIFEPEDMDLSEDNPRLSDKEKAELKANRERMLWVYMNELVLARKAYEEHIEHMIEMAFTNENYKKQLAHEKEILDFLKRYEDILRQAYLERVEAELNVISMEVSNEQMQYDAIVDALASKISEKLPNYTKEKAADLLRKTEVLREMLEDEGAYQTYYDLVAAKDYDSLYNIYAARVMLKDWSEYADDMNKAIVDKVTMENKIAVDHSKDAVKLCGEDESFKEYFSAQERKYSIATSKVAAGHKSGKVNPKDLALVFAERAVMKQLIAMQENARTDEAISKAEAMVKDTDYEPMIEKIVKDPAFNVIMKNLPNAEYDTDSMNRLFDKYVKTKGEMTEAKVVNNANSQEEGGHAKNKQEEEIKPAIDHQMSNMN